MDTNRWVYFLVIFVLGLILGWTFTIPEVRQGVKDVCVQCGCED